MVRRNCLINHVRVRVILILLLKELGSSGDTHSDVVVADDEVSTYTIKSFQHTVEQIEVIQEVILPEVAIQAEYSVINKKQGDKG